MVLGLDHDPGLSSGQVRRALRARLRRIRPLPVTAAERRRGLWRNLRRCGRGCGGWICSRIWLNPDRWPGLVLPGWRGRSAAGAGRGHGHGHGHGGRRPAGLVRAGLAREAARLRLERAAADRRRPGRAPQTATTWALGPSLGRPSRRGASQPESSPCRSHHLAAIGANEGVRCCRDLPTTNPALSPVEDQRHRQFRSSR